MKTNVKKIILSLAVSSVMAAFAFADSAEIISVKGKVEVNRKDAWVTLNVGDKVSESEMISTGFQSEAKVKYKDSVMQLGAMSRVTLSKLSQDSTKDVVDVYLNTGAVRSKVNHSADKKVSYTVRNPVAVASVRGTDFISFDDGSVICFTGAVVLTPASLYEAVASEEAVKVSEEAEEIPASEGKDPADGESTVTTPASDVAPDAPAGGVMVLGGQQSAITMNGSASTPFEAAVKEVTGAAAAVTTQAASESVTMGQSASSAAVEAVETPAEVVPVAPVPETPSKAKGTVEVEIKWPSN